MTKKKKKPTIFKVNKYISLHLIYGETQIWIGGKQFRACTYLILNIPINETEKYDDIKSIDHLLEKTGLETNHIDSKQLPSKKALFWGHCSNFQTWVEHDYDTRLIDSRLAFPILKKLRDLGDPIAKRVYKEEIIYRIKDGYNNAFFRLKQMNALQEFTTEELKTLLHDLINIPHFKNRTITIHELEGFIKYQKRLRREEKERKEKLVLEQRRRDRLERMWQMQEANVRANERKKQQTLLYWVYDTPEAAIPFFTRAYREMRWLEQMLIRHSVGQIAKRANVSNATIYYWIGKHKISISGIKAGVRMIRNRTIKFKVGGRKRK